MPSEPEQIESWLAEEWTSRLAAAFEAMIAERPALAAQPLSDPPSAGALAWTWRQPLTPLSGAVWIVAPAGASEACGEHVMQALGVEDASAAEQNSTFQEMVNQALGGLAQALTQRLKREVNATRGSGTNSAVFPPAAWTALEIPLGAKSATVYLGFEQALVASIAAPEPQPAEPPPPVAPQPRSPVDHSKTFGLLLEVELPVAISFGRAQIPLKDALKLTSGSIVELNRAISEPVEIIVNNCVIARGEVVVVEGNFGVRIQEVVNRQERLRTVQ